MTQDDLKRAVAEAAVTHILPKLQRGSVIGVGTGSTANYFIECLASYKEAFAGAVASSEGSADRLRTLGIRLCDLNDIDSLKVYVDGADEVNPQLALIKGGGAALTREKIVAAVAEEFICIADDSKWVDTLGQFPLPIEVIPMARNYVMRELAALGGRPMHRKGVITDNGNDIIDVHGLKLTAPQQMESTINQIAGVVTNGLFALRPADVLLLGTTSGVKAITAPPT